MDACTHVLRNGAKTETFAPQNDRTTEWNVNFLLTAAVIRRKLRELRASLEHLWAMKIARYVSNLRIDPVNTLQAPFHIIQ